MRQQVRILTRDITITYYADMDEIFKAINDPTRRALLEALRIEDGQSLTQLEARLEMTRFGVMRHLGVLEAANLVTSRKSGRFKYHYLNVQPLREIQDTWLNPLLNEDGAEPPDTPDHPAPRVRPTW